MKKISVIVSSVCAFGAACALAPEPRLIERRAPYPDYEFDPALKPISFASVRHDPSRGVNTDRSLSLPGHKGFKGYRLAELDVNTSYYVQRLVYENRRPANASEKASKSFSLKCGDSILFDHSFNDAGFPGCRVRVLKPGRLVMEFDETMVNGEARGLIRYHDCLNAIVWDFSAPGEYSIASFEP